MRKYYISLRRFPMSEKNTPFSEDSKTSSVCPSGKSSVKIKINVEY